MRGAPPTPDTRSYTPALTWPAAIMRNRSHVPNGGNGEPRRLQGTQRRFAARARPCHLDFERAHAVLLGLLSHILRRDLSRIGGRFARPLETHSARRRPCNRVALGVGHRDHRIVERRIHMGDARSDVLAFAPPDAGGFLAHSKALSRLD